MTPRHNIVIYVFLMLFVGGCVQEHDFRIERFVKTLNDNPDYFHSEMTPSVKALVKIGEEAIPRMLDLMLLDDIYTRLRAQTVIERITMQQYGFLPGHGWIQDKCEHEFQTFWKDLGDLDYRKSKENREYAVGLWRKWVRGSFRDKSPGQIPK